MAKRRAKSKNPPVDGLGPDDLKRIHKALGQVRKWSYPVRLAKKRAMGADGFPRCENQKCPSKGKPVPSVQADHIEPIGEIAGPEYLKRMFVPSTQLQCLCKKCHDAKTKAEKVAAKELTCWVPEGQKVPEGFKGRVVHLPLYKPGNPYDHGKAPANWKAKGGETPTPNGVKSDTDTKVRKLRKQKPKFTDFF